MQFWRDAVKRWLLQRDIILSRPPGQFTIGRIKWPKVRDRGLNIAVALDGGAHVGEWAEELKEFYPHAQVLMVEPREEAQARLQAMAARLPGLRVVKSLLGPTEGTLELHEHTAQSSVLANSGGQPFGRSVTHPVTTIDRLFETTGWPLPDLIKLDLQGFELEALKGGARALAHAEAVLLEVSFFAFQSGQPIVADVVGYMDRAGFQLYDIFSLAHRPLDGALAQGDFLFVKKTSKLVADHRWSQDSPWA